MNKVTDSERASAHAALDLFLDDAGANHDVDELSIHSSGSARTAVIIVVSGSKCCIPASDITKAGADIMAELVGQMAGETMNKADHPPPANWSERFNRLADEHLRRRQPPAPPSSN